MTLYKLEEFDPLYIETFEGDDVKGFDVYTETDEKVGEVSEVLVDQDGSFRYVVLDVGFWIFSKEVMLPADLFRIDYDSERVYAVSMTKEAVKDLPEFSDRIPYHYDGEVLANNLYPYPYTSPLVSTPPSVDTSVPMDVDYPVSTPEAIGNQVDFATYKQKTTF